MKNNAIWRPSWVATIPEVNTPAFGVRVVGQCRGPLRTGQLQDPHGGVVVIEHRPPPGVVMWRIYYLNKLGREVPQAPCTIYFEDTKWKALMVFTTQNPVVPKDPRPCGRPSIVSRVSGDSWVVKAMANPAPRPCGWACNAWTISPPCGSSCFMRHKGPCPAGMILGKDQGRAGGLPL